MKNQVKLRDLKNFLGEMDNIQENNDEVLVRKQVTEGINELGEREFDAVISNNSVDADGDILMPLGCDMSKFLKNPVVLFGHVHNQPPVGKIIALKVTEKEISARIKMAETAFAEELWSLIKGGFIRAHSIGFTIKDAVIRGTKEFNEFIIKNHMQVTDNCNRIIKSFTLYEDSVVSIPSNSEALITAISTKSINISDKLAKEMGISAISSVPIILNEDKDISIPIIEEKEKKEEDVQISIKENKEIEKIEYKVVRKGGYVNEELVTKTIKEIKSGKIILI